MTPEEIRGLKIGCKIICINPIYPLGKDKIYTFRRYNGIDDLL